MGESLPRSLDEVIPKWAEQGFVSANNEFMAAALHRIEEMHQQHPEVSNPTAVSISKNGKRLVLESGGQIHPSFCPRIALGSPSGTEYEFCPNHCAAENHAEARAARAAREQHLDIAGGEAFLAGHYWACMPCWEALRSVGITKLRLVEDAISQYKNKRGALSPNQGKLPRPIKIAIIGNLVKGMAEFAGALKKVGFEIVESNADSEISVMLTDISASETDKKVRSGLVITTDKETDYRKILTDLSRTTEPLFDKVR